MLPQHRVRRSYLAGLLALLSMGLSHAASFLVDDQTYENPALRISGVIDAGDAERLVSMVLHRLTAGMIEKFPSRLILDSRGGSVQEAVKIAAVVEALRLTTTVRGDEFKRDNPPGICASACFLIWLAGYERHASGYFVSSSDELANRVFSAAQRQSGMVGLHRPYLNMKESSPPSLSQAQSQQRQVMASLRNYLHERNVEPELVGKMMAQTSKNIYWLRPEEVNALSKSPEHEELLAANCEYRNTIITAESSRDDLMAFMHETSRETLDKQWACSRSLVARLRKTELPALAARMNAGWRPWQ